MIKRESYHPRWLDQKIKEHKTGNYGLSEKMVYAFTLLEQLSLKGLDFIFKGGTSLVLMMDKFHRFSKDIDIIISEKPDNLHSIFNLIVADTPFTRWEESVRKNDEFKVPKEHYKFFYQLSRPTKYSEEPVLLDIIYVQSCYPQTRQLDIAHSFLDTEEPFVHVTAPTLDSITGDKLTAFAPSTIGVPRAKKKDVEIVKQLFDLNNLFQNVTSHKIVKQSFEQTAALVIKHYHKDFTTTDVYNDILNTAFCLATSGKLDPELFKEMRKGITALPNYLSKDSGFNFDIAVAAAAKIAYVATCFMHDLEPELPSANAIFPEELIQAKIEHKDYAGLNKILKAGNPQAWYFWYKISGIRGHTV